MLCRIVDLKRKVVVCLADGTLLGTVCDINVDTVTAKVVSIVVYGRPKLFGLLGRDNDYVVPWEQIEVIGEDTILVGGQFTPNIRRQKKKIAELLGFK